jgi:transposase InsO family protein
VTSGSANLKHHDLLGSMGTVGDCFDNAPMESFWGTMQIELLDRKRWMTYVELATAMADYILNFYNPSAATAPSATSRRTSSKLYHHQQPRSELSLPWANKRGPGQWG